MSSSTMKRSRVTLAMIEAQAMDMERASPLGMLCWGMGIPGSFTKSMSRKSGGWMRLATAISIAMHVALAVGSRVVVLFGPTSSAEIELFGCGGKVVPDMDCLVCYKQECDFVPNCMDLIAVDAVEAAVVRQLRSVRG